MMLRLVNLFLQKNIPLGPTELGLLTTVELQTIHFYDKLRVVVLSTDIGKIRVSKKIMLMSALIDLNIQYDIYFQCGIIDNLASQQSYISYISYILKFFPILDYILGFFPIFLYFSKN
jgi:hypothetical protein